MIRRAVFALMIGLLLPWEGAAAQDTAVDSLLASARLQEAAWAARESGDTMAADAILARLETILRSPPVDARPLGIDSQGVSYTWRLDHGNGVHSIFKVGGSDIFCPTCGADQEVAAYRVDRALGVDLTPMTVRATVVADGDTMSGSTMYWVHDATVAGTVDAKKPDLLRFFDAAIGNSDRHNGNWFLLHGRPIAIDHNRAFRYQPPGTPKTCWETEVDSIARPGRLGDAYARYRSLPDDSLAAVFDGLEPELRTRFLAMRPAVIARIEARADRPKRSLPHQDCTTGG